MPAPTGSIRRSVALPEHLVEQAMNAAPQELQGNFNGLVRRLLEEFVRRREAYEFAEQMQVMASDPAIRDASSQMSREFEQAEMDGLEPADDSAR